MERKEYNVPAGKGVARGQVVEKDFPRQDSYLGAFLRRVYSSFSDVLPGEKRDIHFLDIGGFNGFLSVSVLRYLPLRNIRTIYVHVADISPAGFDQLEWHPGGSEWFHPQIEVNFSEGDVRSLAYQDGFFDGVIARAVLHFLPPDEMPRAIQNISRVLKPSGSMMIQACAAGFFGMTTNEETGQLAPVTLFHKRYATPMTAYTPDSIQAACLTAGLQDLHYGYFDNRKFLYLVGGKSPNCNTRDDQRSLNGLFPVIPSDWRGINLKPDQSWYEDVPLV